MFWRFNVIIEMVGLRFGRLLVKAKTATRSKTGSVVYSCLCDCGVSKDIDGVQLRRGASNSCGCLGVERQKESAKTSSKTHGGTVGGVQTGTYKTWITMRRRCFDKGFKDYPRYGGSGITVCPEWEDFNQFRADMGERPAGMTLDRENNKLGYCATNCRWATHLTQMNNTSRNRLIEYKGQSHTVAEWARILKVPRARLSARLNGLGWSVEKTFGEL